MTKRAVDKRLIKPVLVAWVDATSHDSWTSLADAVGEPADYTVFSMGFMIENTPEYVKLVSNLAEDEQAFGLVTVPAPWVHGIWEISLKRLKSVKQNKRSKK